MIHMKRLYYDKFFSHITQGYIPPPTITHSFLWQPQQLKIILVTFPGTFNTNYPQHHKHTSTQKLIFFSYQKLLFIVIMTNFRCFSLESFSALLNIWIIIFDKVWIKAYLWPILVFLAGFVHFLTSSFKIWFCFVTFANSLLRFFFILKR